MINILNGFKKDFVELLKVLTEQLIVILMKLLTTLTILLLRLEQLKMKYMKTVRKWQIRKIDRKSTRLNSSHVAISYAVFFLKKNKNKEKSKNTHYTCT